jgi:hypothetical protein
VTLLCRFCTYTITWNGTCWVDTATDGDACDGYLVHEPASLDVASCTMCIAAIVNPGMDFPSCLTLVPAGMTPSYDATDNGGWESSHPCDTCGRTHMFTRRVVTLTPERPNMPTAPAIPDYAMHYDTTGVDICTGCLMAAANGVEGEALCLVPAGYHVIPGAYTIGSAESWFSYTTCDTCGDTLGGDRHQATLMSIERVPCQQCIDLVRHTH